MTNTEWHAIVKAWAAWVCGDGPMVQGCKNWKGYPGHWVDWGDRDFINKCHFDEWRVKPQADRFRVYRLVGEQDPRKLFPHVWFSGECEPVAPPGYEFVHEWTEIPE